jgi:hypothetical protein
MTTMTATMLGMALLTASVAVLGWGFPSLPHG